MGRVHPLNASSPDGPARDPRDRPAGRCCPCCSAWVEDDLDEGECPECGCRVPSDG